jgi:protein-S-isoprenylcysteine O-methyltransferase Ste14
MTKVLAVVAPILTLIAIAAFGLSGSFLSGSPAAVVLYLLSIGLAAWARRSFPLGAFRAGANPGGSGVIRSGPYRYVRHPMYSAALVLVWTASLVHFAWWHAVLAVAVTVALAGRILWEETLLRAAFSDYAEYAGSTSAVIPYVI